ncbi:hypothetical protein RUND412_010933 [Rhizina undulata]
MPVKLIVTFGIIVAAAGTLVIYEHREQIFDFVDEQRRRIAHSLRNLADRINPEHRDRFTEVPLSAQNPFAPSRRSSASSASFDEDTEYKGAGFSWSADRTEKEGELRRRGAFGSGGNHTWSENEAERNSRKAELLFEAGSGAAVGAVAVGAIPVVGELSRRSSTATLDHADANSNREGDVVTPGSSRPNTAVTSASVAAAAAVAAAASELLAPPEIDLLTEESSQPYWSIHEWVESAVGSSSEPSLAGSAEEVADVVVDEVESVFGSEAESVGSWMEVESAVSEDH